YSSLENNYYDIISMSYLFLSCTEIKNTGHSVTEIAYILGFTDVSSFTRAFRRWTDLSPIHYREKYLACS
ncbi:AraC family transcriptional regulator, partial [Acinetobacter baumannii]|nr:AraC family transcriptional regulator [Acinetobacter baumannii]